MVPILYQKERELLEFITQFIQRYGYAPTLQEMADAVGVSAVATVHEHLHNLEAKGFVKTSPGAKRGIEILGKRGKVITGEMTQAQDLPVLGYIAAGQPLEPHTDPNLYMSVASGLLPSNKASYILQVKGNSMVDDGILDGDYVVIQHQEEANNGDIVVAILRNGLATLKKIFFEEGRIRLQPANSQMSPIYVTEVKIQGKVCAIIRKY